MTEYNRARPMIMHIDLNSCFATIEQQSRPMLRDKPIAIVNRRHQNSAIVTASYEAKARGVKVGMRGSTARLLCPTLILVESDPPKYYFVYRKLMAILTDYSPNIKMKSIDEGLIDFSQSPPNVAQRDLVEVGREIKQRLRTEVGEYMTCNIGIGTNRFLAKIVSGINKPDGLTLIDWASLREVYSQLKLTDLTGIANQLEKRLKGVGIMTPLEFLDADEKTLVKLVFRSKCGRDWHRRLRGWEVDDVDVELQSIGRQFVLDQRGLSYDETLRRFHGLCEDVVAKLRLQGVRARAVKIYAKTYTQVRWHNFTRRDTAFDDEATLFALVCQMLTNVPLPAYEIGVTCYDLVDSGKFQPDLFGVSEQIDNLTDAIDRINLFWGDRTIHSAETLGPSNQMKRKISFGSIRYL